MSESAFKKTTCRHCGVNVEYPEEAEGQTANCPQCGKFISLPKSYPALPQSSFSENAPELKAPAFVVEPKDVQTTEGEYVFFKAKAEGVPKPAYQWFSIDRDNNRQILTGETKSDLLVVNPRIGIARYVVQATNSVGDVQSRVATLSVEKRVKLVESQISPAQVKAQEDIERQRRRIEAEKAQIGIKPAAPATANPNTESSFIGEVVMGIIIGIVVALGIGVACLVASKMGWDGLGSVFYQHSRRLVFEIWMLAIPPVILIIFLLLKKKNQTYKGALEQGVLVSCLTIGFLSCYLLTHQFFYSTPPEKFNIDYGVNWALATEFRIEWTDKKTNIFDNYRLTNQYSETVGSEKHFVYDFEAQCPLMVYRSSDGSGRTDYAMARGNPNSRMTTLSGSVTLVAKGQDWYCSKTVRVH